MQRKMAIIVKLMVVIASKTPRIPSNATSLLPLKSTPSNNAASIIQVLSVHDHLNKFPVQFSTSILEELTNRIVCEPRNIYVDYR